MAAARPRNLPTRCAIYTRQSVVRRGMDVTLSSCRLQRDLCREFIHARASRGWSLLDEGFDDEGFSGASVERPALERLFARIRAGNVDRVVVYRLDRLTRRLADWALLVRLFDHFGVGLTVVSGMLDVEGGSLARLQLDVLAIFAELERDMIGERLTDNRAARRAHGLRTAGRLPLGYTTDHNTKQLTVLEPEAATVRWLFTEAAGGKTTTELVAAANASERRTKTGGAWSPRAVLRLLQNPVYRGRHPDGSPARHAPLVDDELFARVQSLIAERRTREPSHRTPFDERFDPFILRGLLRCEQCGHVMSPSMSESLTAKSAKDAPRYYRCRTVGCDGGQVAAGVAEQQAFEALQRPDRRLPGRTAERMSLHASVWHHYWPRFRHLALLEVFTSLTWRSRTQRVLAEARRDWSEIDAALASSEGGRPRDEL
ncbi:MAG: recombinase family protein [Polyangiaceae bacterium]|nr:recombinase family protein [Polyangiaceae bacterium]